MKIIKFVFFISFVCIIGYQYNYIQNLEKSIQKLKDQTKELNRKEYLAIKKCENEVRWKNDCILWELNKVDK